MKKYRFSCARSYRTLRDGSFEDAFPGTPCQATIGRPYGTNLARERARAISQHLNLAPFNPLAGVL